MTTIQKFKAYEGAEFTDQTKCEEYEARCRQADTALAELPPLPNGDGCSFQNGHGYIQHKPEVAQRVRLRLLELAKVETDHKFIQQSIDNPAAHSSWAHRIISECCNSRLNAGWHRIVCMDAQYREWGQPFYASNPEKAEHIILNP